jgi:hypothetical protein
VVEDVGVASAEAARASDEVSKLEGHLAHEAEGAAAPRLREADAVRLELGERVGGPYVVSRARANTRSAGSTSNALDSVCRAAQRPRLINPW